MLYVMIKPASGQCNLRCKYCFYQDETSLRDTPSYGNMTEKTLTNVIRKACSTGEKEFTFVFQGGEPTLRGLDFFKKVVELQNPYKEKGMTFFNTIQTNGLLIDEDWADFLAENQFLVGLSLDGTKAINDSLRIDAAGNGSYDRIKKTADLFTKKNVDFNIVTVISNEVAKNAKEIYREYLANGWTYLQFIPCLDPYEEKPGGHEHSLTPAGYGQFLCDLFDEWYTDVMKGDIIFIRYFENILGMLLGYPPESCGVCGTCAREYIVEADGSVFPCDFYVLDGYEIGNLNKDDFYKLANNERKLGFLERSLAKPEECIACQYRMLCNGGCIRNRDYAGNIGSNYFCESFKQFFAYSLPRFREIIQMIQAKSQNR